MILKKGQHSIVIGRTGSGKSVYAVKAVADFHRSNPDSAIIIVNHKNSKDWNGLIAPSKRGTFPQYKKGVILNIIPFPWQDEELNAYLWNIYSKAYPCLVVFDEGQNISDNKYPAASVLWQQGREMNIGVLTCCQRPVKVSRYAITQSSFITIYNLIGEDDLKTLDGYMEIPLKRYIRPAKVNNDGTETNAVKLKPFHFLEYNVQTGKGEVKEPVTLTPPNPIKQPLPAFPFKKVGIFSAITLLLMKVL